MIIAEELAQRPLKFQRAEYIPAAAILYYFPQFHFCRECLRLAYAMLWFILSHTCHGSYKSFAQALL
jgi:hypothetical protein